MCMRRSLQTINQTKNTMKTYIANYIMDRLENYSNPFELIIEASSWNEALEKTKAILQKKVEHYNASITLVGLYEKQ